MNEAAATAQGTHSTISIEALSFAYGPGEPLILEGIDLDVAHGEFVTLVGSSGCGKSTLLRLIAGLVRPDHGRVLVHGGEVDGPGPDRGMVFQEDAVFPWLTVQRNVAYGLEAQGVKRDERQQAIDWALDLVGLSDARDRYPRELSGGMRKRVDVARAIALKPRVLLMDEPFAALDVMTKESLQEQFLEVWSRLGMTVLFVTHDLEEALYLSGRVEVMAPEPGRLIRPVQVPFDHPRARELRTAPEFARLRADLAELFYGAKETA